MPAAAQRPPRTAASGRAPFQLMAAAALVIIPLVCSIAEAQPAAPPQRVVSMNVCVDQLAMLVAGDEQLYSVSYFAADERASVLAEEARQYRLNHGSAEEIFLMQPDLILAGAYTTQSAVDLLRRLGFRVEVFQPARSFADIRANLLRIGTLLGRSARAHELVAQLELSLREITARGSANDHPTVVVYAANSYTFGAGTLADAIVTAAGFTNAASLLDLTGIAKLPLEQLVLHEPDVIAVSRRWSSAPALATEVLTHPALAHISIASPPIAIVDARWDCGGPFTVEAVHELAEVRLQLAQRDAP